MARETRLERSVRLQGQLQSCALGNVSSAIGSGTLLDAWTRTVERMNKTPRLPSWVRMNVSAYHRGLVDALHASGAIEWRLFFEGRHVDRKSIPDGRWCEVIADKGAFFWRGTDVRVDPENLSELASRPL